jgi:hypothetical protein
MFHLNLLSFRQTTYFLRHPSWIKMYAECSYYVIYLPIKPGTVPMFVSLPGRLIQNWKFVQDLSFQSFLYKTIHLPEGGICFQTTRHRRRENPKAKNTRIYFITSSRCNSIFMISQGERSNMSDLQTKKYKAHSKTSYSIIKFIYLLKEFCEWKRIWMRRWRWYICKQFPFQ